MSDSGTRKDPATGRGSPVLVNPFGPALVILASSALVFLFGILMVEAPTGSPLAPIWYGNAIATAALLLIARRWWALHLMVTIATTFLVFLTAGFPLFMNLAFLPGDLLAIWFSANWIATYDNPAELTRRLKPFTQLVFWSMIIPALISASFNGVALNFMPTLPMVQTVLRQFLMDMNGYAAVLPLAFAIFIGPVSFTGKAVERRYLLLPFTPKDGWQRAALVWGVALLAVVWASLVSTWPFSYIIAASSLVVISTGFLSATLLVALVSIAIGLFASEEMLPAQIESVSFAPVDLSLALLISVLIPLYTAVLKRAQSDAVAEIEKRSAEAEAGKSHFGRLFDESPDAYLVISARESLILDCNRAAESMLRLPRREIVGRSPSLFEPEFQPDGTRTTDLIKGVLAHVAPGSPGKVDMLRRRLDGSEFWVSGTVSRSVDEEGALNLWIWRDITSRKQLEAELRAARELAEQSNTAKSEFLAAMSHEIRTPLNAIISTTSLLQHENLPQQQKRDFEAIESAGRSLLMVVNDVLDLSKIEAGEFILENSAFSLLDLLDDLAKLFEAPLLQKNVRLRITGDLADIPHLVIGDADGLRHVLSNLLANAVKFTSEGSVTLRLLKATPSEAGGQFRLRFEVEDTGIGIPADQQDRLFQPFSQADSSTRRRYGGTGLGLSIVSRLVALMGGTVGVDSVEGQGSTFWVELGFGLDTDLHARVTGKRSGGLRVAHLCAAPDVRERFAALCVQLGWTAIAFERLADLETAIAGPASPHQPDCCVVAIPGIAVSSLSSRGLITVMQPDLTSPSAAPELIDRLSDQFRAAGRSSSFVVENTVVKAGEIQWLRDARILVVDDSDTNIEILARILARLGARTVALRSGAEAVEHVRANRAALDLVLMDLQMPGMDGCDASLLIRRIEGAERLPIIALTAGATSSERDRALSCGMADFLTKPIDPALLVRSVRFHIESYRNAPLHLVA